MWYHGAVGEGEGLGVVLVFGVGLDDALDDASRVGVGVGVVPLRLPTSNIRSALILLSFLGTGVPTTWMVSPIWILEKPPLTMFFSASNADDSDPLSTSIIYNCPSGDWSVIVYCFL